ncbi:nucleotide pyrophosphohydrolase [Candidatus Bathyarchaeota archaeon]|nr:MAG: nucleotide pyrophosphohydrolase [Candidatus Bathyarchaeota archaeon]
MTDSVESLLPRLLDFRHEREWEQFHLPKELATAITIEASELLELFLWNEREQAATVKQDQHKMTRIKEEVADVLIYLLFLSHDLDIDLTEAVLDKLEKNRLKYPEEEYRGRFKEP